MRNVYTWSVFFHFDKGYNFRGFIFFSLNEEMGSSMKGKIPPEQNRFIIDKRDKIV